MRAHWAQINLITRSYDTAGPPIPAAMIPAATTVRPNILKTLRCYKTSSSAANSPAPQRSTQHAQQRQWQWQRTGRGDEAGDKVRHRKVETSKE